MEERACRLAQYIIEHKATVRAAAQKFSISKSHTRVKNRITGFSGCSLSFMDGIPLKIHSPGGLVAANGAGFVTCNVDCIIAQFVRKVYYPLDGKCHFLGEWGAMTWEMC